MIEQNTVEGRWASDSAPLTKGDLMSSAVRFGGAVILAVVFASGFYLMLDGLALAIVVGLCAAAAWLVLDILSSRRSPRR